VPKVTQVALESWAALSGAAKVSEVVLEVWADDHTRSPTTPTGAGVSQCVFETWFVPDATRAKVSQEVLEVWVATDEGGAAGGGGGSSATHVSGYAT
jgi:hypothetical protein